MSKPSSLAQRPRLPIGALAASLLLSPGLLAPFDGLFAEEHEGAKTITFLGYENCIELSNGETRVVLTPVGGRVLVYEADGHNALGLMEDRERQWDPDQPGKRPPSSAGRFDIGPELKIPKRPELWGPGWKGEILGPRHARLTSPVSPGPGVRLVRDFILAPEGTALDCTQTIHNITDDRTLEWCHWSRTFAVGGGMAFVPLGDRPSRYPKGYVLYEEGHLINFRPEEERIRERDGMLEVLGPPSKPKLGFDSYAGWFAYLAPAGQLFVKRYAADPDRVYNEVAGLTISIWYPEPDRLDVVELEPIGPRERLAPGESASFTEHWELLSFPFPEPGEDVDLDALRRTVEPGA